LILLSKMLRVHLLIITSIPLTVFNCYDLIAKMSIESQFFVVLFSTLDLCSRSSSLVVTLWLLLGNLFPLLAGFLLCVWH
jgi:hypothetical protein